MSGQYLFRIEMLSRKKCHPLEAAAEFSGENLYSIADHKSFNSTTQKKVIWNDLVTIHPLDVLFCGLPEYLKIRTRKRDIISNARNLLWKSVADKEQRVDAQFARCFEVAVPCFLNENEAKALLISYADVLAKEGMVVDVSLHKQGSTESGLSSYTQNLQKINDEKELKTNIKKQAKDLDSAGFLVCTVRNYENGEFGIKNRDWNKKGNMITWRKEWLEVLKEAITNSSAENPDKLKWLNKLNVYPEYQSKIQSKLI